MPFFLCMTFDLKTINRKEQEGHKRPGDSRSLAHWLLPWHVLSLFSGAYVEFPIKTPSQRTQDL